jgi:penicillin-insensitive murein endopeptidase
MRFIILTILIVLLGLQEGHAKKKKTPAAPESPVAKEVFGKQKRPSPLAARAIGGYAKGCLAGAKALPIDGPAWQVMRLSRNRNWGHPSLIAYLERLSADVRKTDDWPGLLVGDIAQPMGGPMLTGHASHQIGLDADIWLSPMPDRRLTPEEREKISAVSMLAADGVSVDKSIWTKEHAKLIKRAASYSEVARIFVHPAIKKALCEWAGSDKGWLSRVRPWWGHHYHFHVRLSCPPNSAGCVNQPSAGEEDGCGREVESWLKRMRKPAEPPPPAAKPVKPKPKYQMRLSDLPPDCRMLVGSEPPLSDAVVPSPERKPQEAKTTSADKR